MKTVLTILIAYAVLTAVVFASQRRLLYLPSTNSLTEPSAAARGLRFWPEYTNYRGFINADQNIQAKGTIIVFHGNAGSAIDRDYYIQALAHLGYRIIIAEYPGYGGRSGQPSEAVFRADAITTIQLARQQFGPPIFLWGESLGSGVVAAAVAESAAIADGLILLTPWDSLPSLAQAIYWFLPARWLVLDRYDNIKNLQSFQSRIAVVLAEQDEVIPTRHGRRLYESIAAPKALWVFKNAGHNTWPVQAGQPWWQEVMDYVSEGKHSDGKN